MAGITHLKEFQKPAPRLVLLRQLGREVPVSEILLSV